MTTATAEARSRPAIEPIRTTGPDLNVRSLRSRIIQKSPSWTPSPLSPHSLPLPRLRVVRDDDAAQDDRTDVGQLDSPKLDLLKQESNLRNVFLRPITELVLPSPSTLPSRRSPLSAPLFAPQVFQRPTLAEETRSMLLHAPGSELRRHSVFLDHERRQSAPGGPLHTRAMQITRQRDRRLAGSYRPREPEILVQPIELRRLSLLPSSDTEPPSPYPVDGRLTTRVVVHSPGKKSLVLTRTFDLDELRATLPPISPVEQMDRRASVACLQPPLNISRSSSPIHPRDRRNSHGAIPRTSHSRSPPGGRKGSRQNMPPVAIRLDYARRYLPVLAAVILSELVQPGDTVDVPLPHPRAWEDTVAHVYTGRNPLMETIKQNILYLGGSV
ncbi:hypothetical protein FLAG1_06439 [Fusarium langsethiae]|uniref:Uncharacterized protein n=1 Tax=Fusarium langsethiae TaxID=179993 RepID=A0A0M9EVW2_FUSLA|nr:hypothetical protein FLAG1_06439 [Fusarium langsethiae]GKU03908.1 unnamed protein product [Fusarium langsethiae]GKU19350.1 unnamed protein product [Fusarium langsethiae]